jgi:hypothetical protein
MAGHSWLWLHVWRSESCLYPASGVRITTRTLLGRWSWKRVDRLPDRFDG